MNVCCARLMVITTVASMKAADPMMSGVADSDYIFSNDELFRALQELYSHDEIRDMVDTLAPTLESNPCSCGVTDPFECPVTFIEIVDDLFARPTTQ